MTIEDEVMEWAKGCAVQFDQPMNADEHMRFIGMLIRMRAASDLQWVWRTIERDPEKLIGWMQHVGRFVLAGIEFPPPKMTHAEWFAVIQDLEAV